MKRELPSPECTDSRSLRPQNNCMEGGGGIMPSGKTPLLIFDESTVRSQWYCTKIPLHLVYIFHGAIGPDFLFMEGKVPPIGHLSTRRISRGMVGLAITHTWNVLERCVVQSPFFNYTRTQNCSRKQMRQNPQSFQQQFCAEQT